MFEALGSNLSNGKEVDPAVGPSEHIDLCLPIPTQGPGPVRHLGTCRHMVGMVCVLLMTLVGRLSSKAMQKARHLRQRERLDCRTCFKGLPLPSCAKWQGGEFIPGSTLGSTLLNLLSSVGSLCQSPHVESRGQLCGINLSFHLCGFLLSNSSHQACVAIAFTH